MFSTGRGAAAPAARAGARAATASAVGARVAAASAVGARAAAASGAAVAMAERREPRDRVRGRAEHDLSFTTIKAPPRPSARAARGGQTFRREMIPYPT